MSKKEIADFNDPAWLKLYCTDFFYNPATEGYEPVRLLEPVPKEKRALAQRLIRFWFARAHCFRHKDGLLEGYEIRIFDKKPAVRAWGPVGDRDIWTNAVLLDGVWRILKGEKGWEFGYDLAEDKRALDGIEFWINGRMEREFFKRDL